MKLVAIIGTAVLSLTLGAAAPVYAQQEERGQQDEHAQQQDKKVQQDKPAHQEEKRAQPEEKKAQQEKPAQQDGKHAQQEQKPQQERPARQNEKHAQQEQRPQQERPAAQHEQQGQRAEGNHGRIPDDRYKANFGREHTFRVNQGDFNDHRFQYGGYWFGFAAPWPNNWLYTQDVFVVEINGVYYLCNPMYPGVNVELIVQL